MKETIKKGILAGIGLVDLSIEMASAAIDVLVKTGELTAEQGKRAVEKLAERADNDAGELKARIQENVTKVLEGASLATLPRLEALEKRVAELERKSGSDEVE